MPYELIRHIFGKDSAYKLHFFGIDDNYPGIFRTYLKNIPGIDDKKPLAYTVLESVYACGFCVNQ
jgi:hypothetical protein